MITSFQDLKVTIIDCIESEGDYIVYNKECLASVKDKLTESDVLELLSLKNITRGAKMYISSSPNLSKRFIEDNIDILDAPTILRKSKITDPMLLEYVYEKSDYSNNICMNQGLTLDFIDKYNKDLSFGLISQNEHIVNDFETIIDKYSDRNIYWFTVSLRELSVEFITKYIDELNVGCLLKSNSDKLSEIESISEEDIAAYTKRLKDLDNNMDRFINDLYNEYRIVKSDKKSTIDSICKHSRLSKYIIETYKDKLNMELVNKYQNV